MATVRELREQTTQALDRMRKSIAGHRAYLQGLEKDGAFSDTFKRDRARQLESQHRADMTESAQYAYERVGKAIKDARARRGEALRSSDDKLDWGRLAFLREELAGKLKNPPLGMDRQAYALQLHSKAKERKEVYTLRALRGAAADLAGSSSGGDLRRRFRQDEADEQPPDVGRIDAELAELGSLRNETFLALRSIERSIDPGSMQTGGASPWEAGFMADTLRDMAASMVAPELRENMTLGG